MPEIPPSNPEDPTPGDVFLIFDDDKKKNVESNNSSLNPPVVARGDLIFVWGGILLGSIMLFGFIGNFLGIDVGCSASFLAVYLILRYELY